MYFVASSWSSTLTKSMNALIEKAPHTIVFRRIALNYSILEVVKRIEHKIVQNRIFTRRKRHSLPIWWHPKLIFHGSNLVFAFGGGWVDRAVFLARVGAFKLACSKRFITVLLLQVSRNSCCMHLADINGS